MIPLGNRNVALKRYYRSIHKCLPSSRKLKAKVLAETESNINAYLLEEPSADIASIEARFGSPEQIAVAYVDELGTPELLKKFQIRKRILAIVISAIAVILILWLSVVGWAVLKELDHSNNTFTNNGVIEITP